MIQPLPPVDQPMWEMDWARVRGVRRGGWTRQPETASVRSLAGVRGSLTRRKIQYNTRDFASFSGDCLPFSKGGPGFRRPAAAAIHVDQETTEETAGRTSRDCEGSTGRPCSGPRRGPRPSHPGYLSVEYRYWVTDSSAQAVDKAKSESSTLTKYWPFGLSLAISSENSPDTPLNRSQ